MKMRRKKILFVVNTLGRAGAETALLELLRRLDGRRYRLFLYVIAGQGEMVHELPPYVTLLNRKFSDQPVFSGRGKVVLGKRVLSAFFKNGGCRRKLHFLLRNVTEMRKTGKLQADKLLWRVLSDGARRFPATFDMAVAYLEGASAYYVADHVKARKKCAFVHIDYESAGYTRRMDDGCWGSFDRIFAVSDEARKHFLAVYPEYAARTDIFHNLIDCEGIKRRAKEKGGFEDGYEGSRLLTVGRLTWQKGYDIAIDAMKLLKDEGLKARWYVLGEGDQRRALTKKIMSLGLSEDFVLLGAVENPYPYYAQADLYIHATRFEGKSIAIQEAQILGCPVIASDCNGNREQIRQGADGILCPLEPRALADSIAELLADEEKRRRLGLAAAGRETSQEELGKLYGLLDTQEVDE